MVHQVHKAARKSALDSIYAHIDGKSHRSHEGCGSLKLGTLAKILEYLKGKFPWITCNIIDKAYCKHPQSFVKASSLHLRGVRSTYNTCKTYRSILRSFLYLHLHLYVNLHSQQPTVKWGGNQKEKQSVLGENLKQKEFQ